MSSTTSASAYLPLGGSDGGDAAAVRFGTESQFASGFPIPEDDPIQNPANGGPRSPESGGSNTPLKQNQLSFGNLASRLIFTKSYVIVYITMTLLCLALFLWEVVFSLCLSNSTCLDYDNARGGGNSNTFEVLDIAATSMLLLEVCIRIVATRRTFFKSWFNVFDLLVLTACCVYAVLDYTIDIHPTTSLVKAFILFFRYCIQLTRIGLVLKHHTDRRRMIGASQKLDVDFKSITPRADRGLLHQQASSAGNDALIRSSMLMSPTSPNSERNRHNIPPAPVAAIPPSPRAALTQSAAGDRSVSPAPVPTVGVMSTAPPDSVSPVAASATNTNNLLASTGGGERDRGYSVVSNTSQFATNRSGVNPAGTVNGAQPSVPASLAGGTSLLMSAPADDPSLLSPPTSFAQITQAVDAKARKASRR